MYIMHILIIIFLISILISILGLTIYNVFYKENEQKCLQTFFKMLMNINNLQNISDDNLNCGFSSKTIYLTSLENITVDNNTIKFDLKKSNEPLTNPSPQIEIQTDDSFENIYLFLKSYKDNNVLSTLNFENVNQIIVQNMIFDVKYNSKIASDTMIFFNGLSYKNI